MAKLLYTVDNLVDEVRQQLDELNQDSVSTSGDILPSLNRASDYAFDILARKYPEPILKYSFMDFTSGVTEYDIPESVFEDRILKLETVLPVGTSNLANYVEIQRISYSDVGNYDTGTISSFPRYYCIIGRKLMIVPQPSGEYQARVWQIRNPEKLVLPQGRVTLLNSPNNYVILDAAGSDLTTQSDSLKSYVNVVDGQTGEIKGTLQISSINSNKVTFRTVPTRSTVLNREVGGSLADIAIEQDDYLCGVEGICVPYFGTPTSNFLIQYAVAEITRKLGGQASTEEQILDKFEKQVEKTWVGRQTSLRVKKRSGSWNSPIRPYIRTSLK
jgi:hypothetical protein